MTWKECAAANSADGLETHPIMKSAITNSAFHHIEVPCEDLERAEQFYGSIFGAEVYMRRDADRRTGVPASGTIPDAERAGFRIDGTYLRIGDSFKIGFLKRTQNHRQTEIDHLAFVIDDELEALGTSLERKGIEVIDRDQSRMLIRDPFGMVVELWPRQVLARMGLL